MHRACASARLFWWRRHQSSEPNIFPLPVGCAPSRECLNNAAENSETPVFVIPIEPRSTNSLKRFGSIHSKSSDGDTCPTCFDEYTKQNPMIITKCGHHFHLSCILEWQQRCETCPFCRKVIEFSEAA